MKSLKKLQKKLKKVLKKIKSKLENIFNIPIILIRNAELEKQHEEDFKLMKKIENEIYFYKFPEEKNKAKKELESKKEVK